MDRQNSLKDLFFLAVVTLAGGALGIFFFCLTALKLLASLEESSLFSLAEDLSQLVLFGLLAFLFLAGGGGEIRRRSRSFRDRAFRDREEQSEEDRCFSLAAH